MLAVYDFARPLDGLSTLVVGGGGVGIGRAISRASAPAVVYLGSPLASYVTGQSLIVDGGVTVRGPFPA
jgi:hypothetical protein